MFKKMILHHFVTYLSNDPRIYLSAQEVYCELKEQDPSLPLLHLHAAYIQSITSYKYKNCERWKIISNYKVIQTLRWTRSFGSRDVTSCISTTSGLSTSCKYNVYTAYRMTYLHYWRHITKIHQTTWKYMNTGSDNNINNNNNHLTAICPGQPR